MHKLITTTAVLATAIALGGCGTEQTLDYVDAYSSAKVTAPVTLTTGSAATGKGRISFDCPDSIRDSLDWDVSGGELALTTTKDLDDALDECIVFLHPEGDLELTIEHGKYQVLYHSANYALNLPTVAVADFRMYVFEDSEVTLGAVTTDEFDLEMYDDAVVTGTGSIVGEEFSAYMTDRTHLDVTGIMVETATAHTKDFGNATLAGNATRSRIVTNDNTDMAASQLMVDHARVNADGDSEVSVHAIESADISAEDRATVTVSGNPTETDVNRDDEATVIGI